jgi:hypothetical protein
MRTNPIGELVGEADLGEPVRRPQLQLDAEVKPQYDFIVCGSGSSGSVVARRLAENADVSVVHVSSPGISTITVVALTTATATLPGSSFSSRTASVLIKDTTVYGPHCIST